MQGSIWQKGDISIEDVERAVDQFIEALRGGGHKDVAVAEEHVHATVMTYIRCQAHRKFARSDGARVVDNSSALAGDILLYLYGRRHLPSFLQSVRDNPEPEARVEFVKRLQSLLFLKLRWLPVDWSRTRERIPKTFPIPEELDAIPSEALNMDGENSNYQELLMTVEHIISKFDKVDQEIIRHRLFENLKFGQSAGKLGMKPDAVRKRYGKLVRQLQGSLSGFGFEF